MTSGQLKASLGVTMSGGKAPQGTATTPTLPDVQATASGGLAATWTYGTASGKADVFVAEDRTLTATTAETLNLTSGLKDLFGDAVVFVKLKYIGLWVVIGGDAAGVRVGGAGTNPSPLWFADTSDKALFFPSGPAFQMGSPAGITIGSAVNVKVENLGAVSVTYRLYLAGTSA